MFRPLLPHHHKKLRSDFDRRWEAGFTPPEDVPEPAKPSSPSREDVMAMMQQVLTENPDVADSSHNGQRVADFLKEYTALWCLESIRTAVTYLRNRGQLELKQPPAPPPVVVTEPAEPVEEPLPEVPSYMGNFSTKDEVLRLSRYKEFYFGKHKEQFLARVNEILRRAALAGG